MKLTSESKFFFGIIGATALIVVIAIFLLSRPPKPVEKSVLITPTTHITGKTDAPSYLVEFSDFECPACKTFAPMVDSLIKAHSDALLYAHRHYPLPQHQFGNKAALASEAAGKQGKFWDMWKLLYDEPTLSDSSIRSMAEKLNLNLEQFASDSASFELQSIIDKDVETGESLGINATPTFFLNGIKLTVATPDDLKKQVESGLSKN